MNCLKLVLIIFIVSACSSTKKEREVIVPDGEAKWLYAPAMGCDDSELCASGEGISFNEADLNAKKSLASIFSTKIESTLSISTSNFNSKDQVEMEEEVRSRIKESLNEVLKGVEIHERFSKGAKFFSLAKINKQKTSTFLSSEIRNIDNEIEYFFNLNNRIYIRKLIVLWNRREALNDKLMIVSKGIKAKTTYSEIINIKFKSSGSSSLFFESGKGVPSVLRKKISEEFTNIGYQLVEKNKADYTLNITFKEKDQYLNVSGFKKFSFTVTLMARELNGKKVGSYSVTLESSGRNKKDAFLKVRANLINEIKDNIDNLNLK